MSVVTINKSDTPNQQRVKLNNNFTDQQLELNNSLKIDGSNAMLAPLPMGGNRMVNMGNGVNDTDGVTVGQANNMANRLIQANHAYVIRGFNGTEVVYVDGTTNYAIRVGRPNDAFSAITDASSGNEWTIVIGSGSYTGVRFYTLPNYVNLVGIGKVELTGEDDIMLPNRCTINSNGEWENLKVKSTTTGDFIIQGNPKMEECIFYAPTANLVLGGVKMERNKLIGKSGAPILLDGTSNNYVNWCSLSEDFSGTGTYDWNTVNQIVPNLETYYSF